MSTKKSPRGEAPHNDPGARPTVGLLDYSASATRASASPKPGRRNVYLSGEADAWLTDLPYREISPYISRCVMGRARRVLGAQSYLAPIDPPVLAVAVERMRGYSYTWYADPRAIAAHLNLPQHTPHRLDPGDWKELVDVVREDIRAASALEILGRERWG